MKIENIATMIGDLVKENNKTWRVIYLLLVFILGSGGLGAWAKYSAVRANDNIAIVNASQDGEINHLQDDLSDLEIDVSDLKKNLKEFRKEQNIANMELLKAIQGISK